METNSYQTSRQVYAGLGVDTETALQKLATIPISLHCWQGDDVNGFETGRGRDSPAAASRPPAIIPARARTIEELRADLDQSPIALLPGKHRLNLHASYG